MSVYIPSGKRTAFVRCAVSLLSEEEVDKALRKLKLVLVKRKRHAGERPFAYIRFLGPGL